MTAMPAATLYAPFPAPFPAPWASDWGADEYGRWMALTWRGVRQVFRWMAPGQFLMGSPASEHERDDGEILHEVRLTRGYWLAATACTQALWSAVINANRSRFQDDANNPVERVSWDDVNEFVNQMNALVAGLAARLPTEAEWEYACRAGTTTPFSFGDNVTPDQVNYDGNYPYAGGGKGVYRERTIAVGSLPPNRWGLYEMHGNVWEWCADWSDAYAEGLQTDPTGPGTGTARVLRGGSWIGNGRYTRSARRHACEPDWRDLNVGFRLALGQGKEDSRQAPAEQLRGTRGGEGGEKAAASV